MAKKRLNEKQRLDFDKDFFIGFAFGVVSNVLGSYIWEQITKMRDQKKLNA